MIITMDWKRTPLFETLATAEIESRQLNLFSKKDPEIELRELWTRQGVPKERQDELIAEVTAKAQPGTQIGPWKI